MDAPVGWLEGVGDELAAKLNQAGYDDAAAVQAASTADLLGVEGIGPTRAARLIDAEVIEPDPDTVAYRFEIDEKLWHDWKATLDDDVAIDIQLRALLRREAASDDISGEDAEKIAAIRARKHCMRAMQQVAEQNQAARDEVSEIMQLMDAIVE